MTTATLELLLATCAPTCRAAGVAEVTFPGERAYPESITATADGTLFAGSIAEGGFFRVRVLDCVCLPRD